MTHLWSIGFQVVNFLLLLFLMQRYLWKPVRATIDWRKKEIEDAEASVKARAKAADESRAAYEARTEASERERASMMASTAAALAADREKEIAQARAAMDAERQAAREKLDQERRTAAAELTDAMLDLAVTLARKLLADVSGAAITSAFLDRICESLHGLPGAELSSLRADLDASPTVQVATAPALDDVAKGGLRARLAPYLGAAIRLDFVVDHALIAGAELRFPHARLGHSLQHSLAAARRELAAHEIAHDVGPPELAARETAQEAKAAPQLAAHEEVAIK
jgi:F-type H+-transporting ATPase subunit b